MQDSSKPQKPKKEVYQLPADAARVLTELAARVSLDTGARVTKVSIITELLYLLREAKIDTKKVASVKDIMQQFEHYIKYNK